MNIKQNVPQVRFKGFTDDWERRELGEVFTQTSNYVNPKEDNVELWSLTVEEGLIPKTERYTRDFLVKKEDKFKEVRPGDIVYNPMNMTLGAIGYNNMSKGIAVSGYYVTMVTNFNTDSYFINTWLKSPQAILTYKNYATGSLKEKQRIQFPTLSAISVPFPSLTEQQQIGNYFSNLDHLITLHQRKLETLKKLKKSMLQKMFPKNGSTYPEIRFSGFTDAWEQRRFGEVFVEYSEKNHEELPPLTIIQGKGTMLREESDRNLIYDKSGLKNYKLVNESDFILHLRSFEGGLEVANLRGIVSPAYHIFHGEKIDSRFYYPFFRSKYFISVLLKPHVYGIRDGKSIDVEGMKSIKIPYPTIEEQQAIGDYFTQLDKVITLHQR